MNIRHAANAIGGNDHEAVMLAWTMLGVRVLADRGAQDRRPVFTADQVRLLLRSAFINPFEPVVDRDDCPVWPDRFEERSVGDFLYPGIDRWGTVLGPMRPPSPANHVGPEKLTFLVEEGELSGWRRVVELERLVACIVDQGIGHAQRCDEVVNAAILGKASTHGQVSPAVLSA